MNVPEMLSEMTDQDALHMYAMAKLDLEDAAADQPNSEWHQSCFAAVCMLGQELRKRGISPVVTKH